MMNLNKVFTVYGVRGIGEKGLCKCWLAKNENDNTVRLQLRRNQSIIK